MKQTSSRQSLENLENIHSSASGMIEPQRERRLWDRVSDIFYSGSYELAKEMLINLIQNSNDAVDKIFLNYYLANLEQKRGHFFSSARLLTQVFYESDPLEATTEARLKALSLGRALAIPGMFSGNEYFKRIGQFRNYIDKISDISDTYMAEILAPVIAREATTHIRTVAEMTKKEIIVIRKISWNV